MASKEKQIEALLKVFNLWMDAQEWEIKQKRLNRKWRFFERFKEKLKENSRLKEFEIKNNPPG
jgi:hypothetical protein